MEGHIGMLVLNQGGVNRRAEHNQTKWQDLQTYPVQVEFLQEFTPDLLPNDTDHTGWHCCIPHQCAYCDHPEGIAVRCRTSSVDRVELLAFMCCDDGTFRAGKQKRSTARTPCMAVRIHFKDPHTPALSVMNIHFHHATAKRMTGLKAGHDRVLSLIREWQEDFSLDLLVGDMNQALKVIPEKIPGCRLAHFTAWEEPEPGHDCLGLYVFESFDKRGDKLRQIEPKKHSFVDGAHWPLLVYWGNKPRRSIVKKIQRAAKRKSSYLAKRAAQHLLASVASDLADDDEEFEVPEDTPGASASTSTMPPHQAVLFRITTD